MSRCFVDGDFTTPNQHGPTLVSCDTVTGATIYTVTLRQFAEDYAASEDFTDTLSTGKHLVDWTSPRDVGCGVVEWQRTYSTVPPSRTRVENFAALYQYIANGKLYEIPCQLRARIEYTYAYYTPTDALAVSTDRKELLILLDDTINNVGGPPPDPMDTERLGADVEFTQWRGFIWEFMTPWIPVVLPTEVT